MKIRIVNNRPSGTYPEEYLERNADVVINGAKIKDWELTDKIPDESLVKPFWNDSDWIESATQEEIDAKNLEIKEKQIKAFLSQKRIDGKIIFDDFEYRITASLIGKPMTEVQDVINEIDNIFYKPLNLVASGDFASAMILFQTLSAPTNEVVLNFWNELKDTTINYYSTKYPTE